MKRLATYVLPILIVCFIFLTSCAGSGSSKNATWRNVNQKFMELVQEQSKTMEFIKNGKTTVTPSSRK